MKIVYIAVNDEDEVLFVSSDYDEVAAYAEKKNAKSQKASANEWSIDPDESPLRMEQLSSMAGIDYDVVSVSKAIDLDKYKDVDEDDYSYTIEVAFGNNRFKDICFKDIIDKLKEKSGKRRRKYGY